MALIEMVMPKMGESIMEGTILKWLKNIGESIKQDEAVLEVATDKVDTEVPSLYAGVLKEIFCKEGEIVTIGKTIAIIETEAKEEIKPIATQKTAIIIDNSSTPPVIKSESNTSNSNKFYSPLVLNIAREENISLIELESINGTGKDNRVTKQDIFDYLEARKNKQKESNQEPLPIQVPHLEVPFVSEPKNIQLKPAISFSGKHELIEMDRMRKMISERMLESKRISAHVTSFVEADVTNVIYWRNRMKQEFQKKEGDIITLTPIFIEAIGKAMKDYPMMNISVDGDNIIVKKDINKGMVVALSK